MQSVVAGADTFAFYLSPFSFYLIPMSWEAYRLTSKSPSEVYTVLGPHGVDDLLRQAIAAAWREFPEERRTFATVRQRFFETWTRNLNIWRRIKKPTPEAFFADFIPHDNVEAHIRQAFVLCWMMMPRTGGRKFSDTVKIMTAIYDRNMAAWAADNATFTGTKVKPKAKKKKTAKRKKK
jgi:hypothetical protein